ncbi:hypothetical protein [Nitratireductor alexandrii]|uniref:hypothetical protein n=1 Tax=Nitratireductor alexandrii TaxID=2448161 RepID=UPI000FDBB17A|nr:hypothetical protein [Nitratireductor alexandrii]
MSKKLKRAIGFEGMPFGEALERLLRVDPKEIDKEIAKTKREAEEIERDAEKTEDSIERGARRTKHRFRL